MTRTASPKANVILLYNPFLRFKVNTFPSDIPIISLKNFVPFCPKLYAPSTLVDHGWILPDVYAGGYNSMFL